MNDICLRRNFCPFLYSKHVLTEDTVGQRIEGHCLHSVRLITKTNKMPKWGERIVPGPRYVSVVEESIVDPKKKTLTTYTRNIGYTKLLVSFVLLLCPSLI